MARRDDDQLGALDPTSAIGTPWWVRLRSAVLLMVLLVLLGLAVAAVLGVVVVALGALFDRALA